MDQEYEERTKTRQLEIRAVSKALAFLSSDEAHDLFTRTFNFVQVRASIKSHKRAQVSKVLSDAAQKFEDLAMTIDTLAKEIEVLKADVAELQVQMKRAGEDREKQNKEFQVTVADQRATQKLLAAAL